MAQVVLGNEQYGEYLSINLGWGLGVTMGDYVAGGISGPTSIRPSPWRWPCIADFPGGKCCRTDRPIRRRLRRVRPSCTSPTSKPSTPNPAARSRMGAGHRRHLVHLSANYLSTFPGGFVDQVVGTAHAHHRDHSPSATPATWCYPLTLGPIVVGAPVLLIGMTYGLQLRLRHQPGPRFGPRLFTDLAGWGKQVFAADDHWWWVPIVGPLLGGVLGGFLYDFFVGSRLKGPKARAKPPRPRNAVRGYSPLLATQFPAETRVIAAPRDPFR